MLHKKACFEGECWGTRGEALGTAGSWNSTYTNENSRDGVALEGKREEVETTSGESFEA